jgi:WD40 repeat protein
MTPEGLTVLADVGRPTNPFPGLRPFEFGESHLYFGRDGQSDQLIRKLAATRFVAVVGTSGSGKSSLVRAGLLPDLFGGFMPGAGSRWRVCLMRPSNDPLGNLARALNSTEVFGSEDEENRQIQTAIAEATLRRGSLGLVEAVRQNRMASNESLLVVVDQFEELFRFAHVSGSEQYRYEAAAFVKLLLEAARQRELNIYVVLTMRSDFLGDCSIFWDLPEAVNEGQYLIPRMTRDQRAEAITGPIAVCGGRIAQRLVNRLLNDTGDNPDMLPILQHALMRTWENWAADHAEGEPVDLRHYEAVGTMSDALSRHADEAFAELTDERSRLVAERVFKALTEKGEDNREVRRPTVLADLCAQAAATTDEVISVIEIFRREGRSFLMPPPPVPLDEESLIDISHESLIRNWTRLKEWVEQESGCAQIYRRLAETAVLHERSEAGLWRDPDLQLGLDWRGKHGPQAAWATRYHPAYDSAMKFLDASVKARDDAALEEGRRRRREIRRTRLAAAVFFLLFMLALAAFAFAYTKTLQAQEALRAAEEAHGAAAVARGEAERLSDIAEVKKKEAQDASDEAERKRKEAEGFRDEAQKQSALASLSMSKADEARRNAEKVQAQADAAAAELTKLDASRRSLLYASDINLAQQAYDSGSIARTRQLLYAHSAERGDLPGFDWHYLWKLTHDDTKTVTASLNEAARVALTDDGRAMVANKPGAVDVWDVLAGKVTGSVPFTDEDWSTLLAISPDARRVAFNSTLKAATFMLGEVGSPGSAVPLKGQLLPVSVLAFSPDGQTLAVGHMRDRMFSGSEKPKLELWDVHARRVNAEFEHETTITAVAFSPVSGLVATGTPSGKVSVWNVNSKERHCEVAEKAGGITTLAFSQDGELLAAGDGQGMVRVLRMSNCELNRMTITGPADVKALAFSPDRRRVAVGYRDKSLQIWDLSGHQPEEIITFRRDEAAVSSARFLPDGALLAMYEDGVGKLWDVEARVREHWLRETHSVLRAVTFSPDGKALAAGGDNRAVILWDAETHRKVGEKYLLDFGEEGNIDFSWQGQTLATVAGREPPRLWAWDGGSFKELGRLKVNAGTEIYRVVLSPDGKLLLTIGRAGDGTWMLTLWDVASKKVLERFTPEGSAVRSAAFSPDGSRIAAALSEGTLKVWDGAMRRELFTVTLDRSQAVLRGSKALAFSPDGRVFMAGLGDGHIKAWDLSTKGEVASTLAHPDGVNSVTFSPDGRTFATGGSDRSVKLWSASSFQQLMVLKGHTGSVMSVAFSPDGRELASADANGVIRVWRAAGADEVKRAPR